MLWPGGHNSLWASQEACPPEGVVPETSCGRWSSGDWTGVPGQPCPWGRRGAVLQGQSCCPQTGTRHHCKEAMAEGRPGFPEKEGRWTLSRWVQVALAAGAVPGLRWSRRVAWGPAALRLLEQSAGSWG